MGYVDVHKPRYFICSLTLRKQLPVFVILHSTIWQAPPSRAPTSD